MILPNAMLFKEPVTVRTDRDLRRVDLICGVTFDADVGEARAAIRDAVEGLESVSSSEPVQVSAKEFGTPVMFGEAGSGQRPATGSRRNGASGENGGDDANGDEDRDDQEEEEQDEDKG